MQAVEMIELIFSKAPWEKEEITIPEAFLSYKVEFENYSLILAACEQDKLYLYVDFLEIPDDASKLNEFLKKACAMQMQIFEDHKINLTLKDKFLRGELVLDGTESNDEIESKLATFLDDVDFFVEHLSSYLDENSTLAFFNQGALF